MRLKTARKKYYYTSQDQPSCMMNYDDCNPHKFIIYCTTFDTKNTVETNTGNNTPMHSLKHTSTYTHDCAICCEAEYP